jgi:hypothetical protein
MATLTITGFSVFADQGSIMISLNQFNPTGIVSITPGRWWSTAVVTFADSPSAAAAQQSIDGQILEGRRLKATVTG